MNKPTKLTPSFLKLVCVFQALLRGLGVLWLNRIYSVIHNIYYRYYVFKPIFQSLGVYLLCVG